LTPPNVTIKKVPGVMKIKAKKGRGHRGNRAAGDHWREVKDMGIKFNQPRNLMIADEIAKGDGPILALVDTVEQGQFIAQLVYAQTGKEILFLTGKDPAHVRRAAVEQMSSGHLRAVLATTIFDEGVDIPELRKVILCSGGKSQVKLLQRLGRGVRTAAGKTVIDIIDFSDTHHKMLRKHALARKKIYLGEGFNVKEER